jgi:hypothetical protein
MAANHRRSSPSDLSHAAHPISAGSPLSAASTRYTPSRRGALMESARSRRKGPTLMNSHDEFHPDLDDTSATYAEPSLRTRVHHIKSSQLSSATAQTAGMRRLAAITGGSVGSEKIWMGETWVSPETVSDNHHHGESETAIFVRRGNPESVFHRQSCSDFDCPRHAGGNRGESSRAVRALRCARVMGHSGQADCMMTLTKS